VGVRGEGGGGGMAYPVVAVSVDSQTTERRLLLPAGAGAEARGAEARPALLRPLKEATGARGDLLATHWGDARVHCAAIWDEIDMAVAAILWEASSCVCLYVCGRKEEGEGSKGGGGGDGVRKV